MTAKAVADGEITDEFLGAFTRRTDEIKRRLRERTLSQSLVMRDLQKIVEGKPLMTFKPWRAQVQMSLHDITTTLDLLIKKGFFIDKDCLETLREIPHIPMLYVVDVARLSREDLGLDNNFVSYKHLRDRCYEVANYDVRFGLQPPTIETGLWLALDLDPAKIKYGEAIVVVTEPLKVVGTFSVDWALVLSQEASGPRIALRSVSWVEEEINSVDGSGTKFAVIGQPYSD